MIDRPFRLTDRRKMNASFVMEHLVCRLKQQFSELLNENLMNKESLSLPESEVLVGRMRYRILGQE